MVSSFLVLLGKDINARPAGGGGQNLLPPFFANNFQARKASDFKLTELCFTYINLIYSLIQFEFEFFYFVI